MMAAIVAPCGRLNIAITLACLESARVRGGSVFPLFRGLTGTLVGLRRFADGAGGFLAGSAKPGASSSTRMARRPFLVMRRERGPSASRPQIGRDLHRDEHWCPARHSGGCPGRDLFPPAIC
jgi:hypothetical protein